MQHLIRERLGQHDAIEQIRELLDAGGRLRRKVLAKDLCDRFDSCDERGCPQTDN